jgi:hypothetical protein
MENKGKLPIKAEDNTLRYDVSPDLNDEDLAILNTPRAEDEKLTARRQEWFLRADCKEKTKRDWRYTQGVAAGYLQATEDFGINRITEEDLEALKDHEITDFHAIGFQVGYLRKLAEIAVL